MVPCGVCAVCLRSFSLSVSGLVRVHGPVDQRCPGSNQQPQPEPVARQPQQLLSSQSQPPPASQSASRRRRYRYRGRRCAIAPLLSLSPQSPTRQRAPPLSLSPQSSVPPPADPSSTTSSSGSTHSQIPTVSPV